MAGYIGWLIEKRVIYVKNKAIVTDDEYIALVEDCKAYVQQHQPQYPLHIVVDNRQLRKQPKLRIQLHALPDTNKIGHVVVIGPTNTPLQFLSLIAARVRGIQVEFLPHPDNAIAALQREDRSLAPYLPPDWSQVEDNMTSYADLLNGDSFWQTWQADNDVEPAAS